MSLISGPSSSVGPAARISSSKGPIASGSIEGARSVFSTSPPSMDPHDLAIASSLSPSCGRPDRPWPSSAGAGARAPRGRVRPASQRRRDTTYSAIPRLAVSIRRSCHPACSGVMKRRRVSVAVFRAWHGRQIGCQFEEVQEPIRRVLDWHEVIDLRGGDGKAVCCTRPAQRMHPQKKQAHRAVGFQGVQPTDCRVFVVHCHPKSTFACNCYPLGTGG